MTERLGTIGNAGRSEVRGRPEDWLPIDNESVEGVRSEIAPSAIKSRPRFGGSLYDLIPSLQRNSDGSSGMDEILGEDLGGLKRGLEQDAQNSLPSETPSGSLPW